MQPTLPAALQPGDTIAIVPTARAIDQEVLQAGIALAESWGLRVRIADGIGRKAFQQAGTAEERAADLQAALNDPSVRAIWCARGGYGTVHLLEHLDLSAWQRDPKWIVGFSDVTVLHSAGVREGIATLHAQMPFAIANKTPESRESLRAALFGEALHYRLPFDSATDRVGTVSAPVVGGNLSLLYALRGTPYDIDPRGKILFLEDLDELHYHLDRMVQNLKLSGWFDGLAGLIIGGMSDMRDKDPADPFGLDATGILQRAIGDARYPVLFGFPAGHESDNRALPLGCNAQLSVGEGGSSLVFAGGSVQA